MKKVILLFFTCLLLLGCQQTEDEVKTEEFVDSSPLYESNAKPRELELRQYGYTSLTNEIAYYCWAKKSVDECPSELNDVNLKSFDELREQVSPIGYPITLYFETYVESPLPLPDSAELYIYEKNGSLTPVEITNNEFNLPEAEGVYNYIYKTIFDGENKGVAFYIFKLRARYMDLNKEE